MGEYIERNAAIKEFSNSGSIFVYGAQQCKAIISRINAVPAADARPVARGKWKEDWKTGCSECSACGEGYLWEDYDGVGKWNFCPNCGARMENK